MYNVSFKAWDGNCIKLFLDLDQSVLGDFSGASSTSQIFFDKVDVINSFLYITN